MNALEGFPPAPVFAPDPAAGVRIARLIGVPARFEGGFDTFTADNPRLAEIATAAKLYAAKFTPAVAGGLRIEGPLGIGKTHLAAAIARSIAGRGFAVQWWKTLDLFAEMRRRFYWRGDYDERRETADDLVDQLRNVELLVLDELGSETPQEWVADALYRILDGRYENLKPIIYTSNYKPAEFAARLGGDGARLASRLREVCPLLELPTVDRRKQID